MKALSYTLVGDGPRERVLLPILSFLLDSHATCPFSGQWFDPREFDLRHASLLERLQRAVAAYPCDLLFVHRDAENHPPEDRESEIADASSSLSVTVVPVVPVRMTEAWLLGDESAIRRAAGLPSGRDSIDLPALATVEGLPDPKRVLNRELVAASGAQGRRRRRFNEREAVYRVAERMEIASLRVLGSFSRLEQHVRSALIEVGCAL
jgi:hypothetical protein